jgi:hypothetical protein
MFKLRMLEIYDLHQNIYESWFETFEVRAKFGVGYGLGWD